VARAEKLSALQSRGGDGFSPSSRARSLLVIVATLDGWNERRSKAEIGLRGVIQKKFDY
jgi:hypothetical protein